VAGGHGRGKKRDKDIPGVEKGVVVVLERNDVSEHVSCQEE